MRTAAESPFLQPADGLSPIGAVAEHSFALVLPVCTLLFLSTGPHSAPSALLWTLPVWLFIFADFVSPSDRRQPSPDLPSWPFEGLLYLLAGLQIANTAVLVDMAAQLSWRDAAQIIDSVSNLLAIRILVGTNSCCSGIAVAHELIHRRRRIPRFLGRLVLCSVWYEHFAVEHLRGHHRHVGTREDPATARLGETYRSYWRRTKFAQYRNAWRLENERLGLPVSFPFRRGVVPEPGLGSRDAKPQTSARSAHPGYQKGAFANILRLLQHEVLLGTLAQVLLLILIATYGGLPAAGIFLLQALAAIRLLEAVNYFQHWGLKKGTKPGQALAAWATDSWFTRHVFVGLARHADHHRHSAKAYQMLEYCGNGPKLPCGYFGMALLAKSFNRRFQDIARNELRRYRQQA